MHSSVCNVDILNYHHFEALKGDDENPTPKKKHAVNPVTFHDVPSTKRYPAAKRQRVSFLENPWDMNVSFIKVLNMYVTSCVSQYKMGGKWQMIHHPDTSNKVPRRIEVFPDRYSLQICGFPCRSALHRSLKPETLCLQKRHCPSPNVYC